MSKFSKNAKIILAAQQVVSFAVLGYLMFHVWNAVRSCHNEMSKPVAEGEWDLSGFGNSMCDLVGNVGYDHYLVRWGLGYVIVTAITVGVLLVRAKRNAPVAEVASEVEVG